MCASWNYMKIGFVQFKLLILYFFNAIFQLEKAKLNTLYPYLQPKTYRDVELEPIMLLKDVKPYRVKAQVSVKIMRVPFFIS